MRIAGLKSQHVGQLMVQLADLLEAGSTANRSLEAIARQASHPPMAKLAKTLGADIANGASLAEAMEHVGGHFSKVHVAMIHAAETGGFLQETLTSLATHATQRADAAKQIKAKLAYPAVLALTVLASVIFLLTYVVPRFTAVYQSTPELLPGPTRALLLASRFVESYWLEILAAIFVAALLSRGLLKLRRLRARWDAMMLQLPGIGLMLRDWHIYSFASTMALLLAGGVTALRSLRLSAEVVANHDVRRQIRDIAAAVERGEPLSGPMRNSKLFDATAVEMIVVSEATGKLGQVLDRLATQRYRNFQTRVGVLLSLLEPAIILVMGLLVGLTVMALLLPVLSMNSLIG